MPIATTSPVTGEVIETFDELPAERLERCLELARVGAATMAATSPQQRAGWMSALATLLDAEADDLAATMTTEMGKPLAASRAEVAKCAAACRFYARHAAGFLAPEPVDAAAVGAAAAYTVYQPLGPVLAVMPWNFPLWQAARFAVPALMAGNVGLLKPASNVPRTALRLAELIGRAGFPAGAFQTLLIGADQVEAVLADRRVAAVTLTGSEAAGRAVAAAAGRYLKKAVLELGGSDPFIVMPSADVARAAAVAATARCQNNGQSCIAAKRFIVHTEVYPAFVRAFVDRMAALRVGDPMDPDTDVGPLATRQVRDDVAGQVADAVRHGASVLCGGTVPDRPGWWYPPTVLTGITPPMRIWSEEVFGPVAALYRVDSAAEAVALANGTAFGLGASVWSRDPEECHRFVTDLAAGMVFTNAMVASYPQLPFGGVKHSGFGRELSAHGLGEFCNVKTVWTAPG